MRGEGSKGNEFIKAYVRLKPPLMDEVSVIGSTKRQVFVNRYNYEPFQYNEVFIDGCKNDYIFDIVMLPIIQHIFEGYNACILAYGQTSSGKTYTMKGVEGNMGLIPLALREIFRRIKAQEMVAKVRISYFEVYNQNIIDLLSKDNPRYLDIRDDVKKTAVIQELIHEEVNNQDESLSFYSQGETRRKFACNNINFSSSRSHTIFKICMEVANQDLTTSVSTISLVDLAGSESISRTNAVGLLKKESENINKSLLALSKVIRALSEKSTYVNFRDSRLTRILQPCLTGHSKTAVICTINQTEECIGESINTLKFGVAANSIKINAQKNIVGSAIQVSETDSKYEQLCNILDEERADKENLQNEITKLHSQLAKCKEFQETANNQINELKTRLELEEKENSRSQVHLHELRGLKVKQEERNGQSLNQFQDDLKIYKTQIAKLNITVNQMKQKIENYKKLNDQLERNERTLLDRLAKYEKELSILQKGISDYQRQNQERMLASKSKKSSIGETVIHEKGRDFQNRVGKQPSDNPYTLSKVIQLSTRILDMKLQLNQYMKGNAELQEENESLLEKISFLERNGLTAEDENLSQRSKSTRTSADNKLKDWQIRNIREQVKKLRSEKAGLLKKLNQLRAILKRNTNSQIEELHGWNRFVEKNFTSKEREYFQFMFDEDPNDFDPLP